MGDLYIAPMPRCPVHGQMHYQPETGTWVCHGYDGEGCDHTVTDAQMDWTHIGKTAGDEIMLGIADLPDGLL